MNLLKGIIWRCRSLSKQIHSRHTFLTYLTQMEICWLEALEWWFKSEWITSVNNQCELQDQEDLISQRSLFWHHVFSTFLTMAQNLSRKELRESTYVHTSWNCFFREITDISSIFKNSHSVFFIVFFVKQYQFLCKYQNKIFPSYYKALKLN